MYPVMLPGSPGESDGFSSYRNPDQLFPERQGTPPDPVGSLYVRFLERLTDAWDALTRRAHGLNTEERHGEGPKTAAPAAPTR